MRRDHINRIGLIVLTGLSLTALLDVVLLGYLRPPLADEGTGAHIFQLSIASLVPAGVVFVATADWSTPVRTAGRLAVPVVVTAAALAALFYLEHSYYPAHYR